MDKTKLVVNTYNKIAGIYTKTYFNDLSDSKYLDKFLAFLPKNAKILDVGSGPGQFSKYIKLKGFEVSGIDYSDEMLAIARREVPNVGFQKMDMRKLSFPPETFDGLLVSYSLIHIHSNEILDTLSGFYKILKPGGFIEIIAQRGKANQTMVELLMPTEKMFFNFFTKHSLNKFLVEAGFKVIFQEEKRTKDANSVGNKIIYTIAQKEE